jgi:syntaxin 1B/2/3
MDETNATAQEVRNILKSMESANKKDDKPGSSEARIRQNMQVTLAKKFMDLMSECVAALPAATMLLCLSCLRCRYTQMQEKTKAKYRERVERQFKIVKPDATAAELKDVVDGDFQDIFAKHLMTNQHKAAQQAIADINDKHQVMHSPPAAPSPPPPPSPP